MRVEREILKEREIKENKTGMESKRNGISRMGNILITLTR